MPVYSQGDPRQKIQLCALCEEPTGRCEQDEIHYVIPETGDGIGPLCPACLEECEAKQ